MLFRKSSHKTVCCSNIFLDKPFLIIRSNSEAKVLLLQVCDKLKQHKNKELSPCSAPTAIYQLLSFYQYMTNGEYSDAYNCLETIASNNDIFGNGLADVICNTILTILEDSHDVRENV